MRHTLISLTLLMALSSCKAEPPPAETEKKADLSPVTQKQSVTAHNQLKVDTFFDASFRQFDRQPHLLNQYKGKTVVAYFWATWCKPCVKEVPLLIGLQNKYKDKNVQFIGIAIDNADKVEKFAKDHAIPYPILIGGDDAMALAKKMGDLVGGLPFMVVIDKNGKLVDKILGEIPEGKLEKILAETVVI